MDSATLLRDRIAKSFRSQDMANETMETRSASEGFFVTPSLAYASGYLRLGTRAVQLVEQPAEHRTDHCRS